MGLHRARGPVHIVGAPVLYQDLVKTIQTLPLSERLSLLEVLTQSLKADMSTNRGRNSSLARVRGILKTDGPLLSDEDIEDSYTDYLIEKYA